MTRSLPPMCSSNRFRDCSGLASTKPESSLRCARTPRNLSTKSTKLRQPSSSKWRKLVQFFICAKSRNCFLHFRKWWIFLPWKPWLFNSRITLKFTKKKSLQTLFFIVIASKTLHFSGALLVRCYRPREDDSRWVGAEHLPGHEFLGVSVEETLAERSLAPRQIDDGATSTSLLNESVHLKAL